MLSNSSVSKARRRRRQDGMRMERESSDIKSSRRQRRKVEALNSMQIVSFLLFIRAKMRRRREAMRIEDLPVALTLRKTLGRRSGVAERLLEWDLDRGGVFRKRDAM